MIVESCPLGACLAIFVNAFFSVTVAIFSQAFGAGLAQHVACPPLINGSPRQRARDAANTLTLALALAPSLSD